MGVSCCRTWLIGVCTLLVSLSVGLSRTLAHPVPAGPNTATDDSTAFTLTILHTNDTYGRLVRPDSSGLPDRGGLAARTTLIRQARENGPTLVLDAGNTIGPDPIAGLSLGASVLGAMGLAGYMAMGIGNHEFDYGLDPLKRHIAWNVVPILAANLIDPSTGGLLANPYAVYELGGLRVGVIGLTAPAVIGTTNPFNTRGIKVADPVETARTTAQHLRQEERVQYVIALSHLGHDLNLALAGRVPSIDLIVGGHVPETRTAEEAECLTELANGVRIVATPRYGEFLGRVRVRFTRAADRFRPVEFHADRIPVDRTVPDAPDVGVYIAQVDSAYRAEMSRTVGQVAGPLSADEVGLLLANIIRVVCGTEIGILNAGGVDLQPLQGAVSRDRLNTIITYRDVLVTLKLTGSQLREVLARSKSLEGVNRHLIIAGVSSESGGGTVNGRPLATNEQYSVTTNQFLAAGGDGYTTLAQGAGQEQTNLLFNNVIVDYFSRRHGPVSLAEFEQYRRRAVVQTGLTAAGAALQSALNSRVAAYQPQNVPILGGRTSIAWNTRLDLVIRRDTEFHHLDNTGRLEYGRIGFGSGTSQESVDRISFNTVYRRGRQAAPVQAYGGLGFDTVFTPSPSRRSVVTKTSAGVSSTLTAGLTYQVGARRQETLGGISKPVEYGIEFVSRYRGARGTAVRYASDLSTFLSSGKSRVAQIEWYNTAGINLFKTVDLLVRTNLFFYRDSIVTGIAHKTEINIGLGYSWGWKWF